MTKPEHFRELPDRDDCRSCAHLDEIRHCSCCPSDYNCTKNDFDLGGWPENRICNDWSKK
jgi:hypothetical protein